MPKKKDKICLVPGQVDRLAHDAYMMGKGQKEGICDTVAGIVEKATTEEERMGTHKKTKKKEEAGLSEWGAKKIKGKISKALDGFF